LERRRSSCRIDLEHTVKRDGETNGERENYIIDR
jgi:hypothetical protein